MDEVQEQFTKPKRHTFVYVVVVFVILAVASFIVLVREGPPSERDLIESIRDDYAQEASQSANGFVTDNEQVNVVTSDDPYFGNPDAPVTIVEFGDFECPYCKQSVETVKALEDAFGNRIFFQYRDFPLVSIHEQALPAALAAECAHDQGNDLFWAYHDRLYQFQDDLADDFYVPLAERVGLDVEEFESCFTAQTHSQEIQTDYDSAIFAGATGTPTFFINGYKVTGVVPAEVFVDIVNTLLENQQS